MDKPFRSIHEQMSILETRGVLVDSRTARVLLGEGYYSVVNGYKRPFLDREATGRVHDDRFQEGTRFSDIYSLFLFDRELRELTFHYLVKVETLLRTACAYRFCEAHQESKAYLKIKNFTAPESYLLGPEDYDNDIAGLLRILEKKSNDPHDLHAYIDYYRDNHDEVPLWVLMNDMTFGNTEHFFDLMKRSEQQAVCKDVVTLTDKLGDKSAGFFHPREARISIEILVKIRNLCAHDERLYCARVGQNKDVDYLGFLGRLRRFLSERDFYDLCKDLAALISRYSNESGKVEDILNDMGLGRDFLRSISPNGEA